MERIQARIETTARMHGGNRQSVSQLGTIERLENLEDLLERLEPESERFEDQAYRLASDRFRMQELEAENLRLNRLVAELLLKNQQLRESN